MKRLCLLMFLLIAATAPLAAQGPGRAGLSSRPIAVAGMTSRERIVVAPSGMTRSEHGALIGALVGMVAGAALSYSSDERSLSSMLIAGLVMAIPVSLIGALIGMM